MLDNSIFPPKRASRSNLACFFVESCWQLHLIVVLFGNSFVCWDRYPPAVGPKEQAGVKVNYTMAQFHATMHSIMGDPTAAFLPLLGLQLAPFLMTLVRKGIASSFTYHRVYAVALYLPYAAMMYRLVINAFGFYEMMWFGFVTILAKRIRLSLRVPAEVCWGVGVPLAVLGKPHVLGLVTETALANRVGTLVFILHTNIKIAERYWPLF